MPHFVQPLESRLQLDATVPAGYTYSTVVAGRNEPTAEVIAPDGRLFVAEQAGDIRVVQGGALLDAPLGTFTVDSSGERGVIGLVLDPNFATKAYRYVY